MFYSEYCGILSENPNGIWEKVSDNPGFTRATFSHASFGSDRFLWKLYNGKFSMRSLNPFEAYREDIDGKFVILRRERKNKKSKKGLTRRADPITIKGQYPFFMTSTGIPVWLDYDRSLSRTPVDITARLQAHHKKRLEKYKVNPDARKPVRLRIAWEGYEYRWKLVQGNKILWTGTEVTEVKCEIAAYRRRKKLGLDAAAKLA